jgi:hypothetical protein
MVSVKLGVQRVVNKENKCEVYLLFFSQMLGLIGGSSKLSP